MESSRVKYKQNPSENANWLSKLFFVWIVPFYEVRNRDGINLNDVYEPLKCDRSELLGDRLEANWKKARAKSKNCSLQSVILRTFWKDYAFVGLLYFCSDIFFRLGQPLLLGYLLDYFREDSIMLYREALLYASGIVILNALNAMFINHIYFHAFHSAMQTRVAVCSLIYRKALRLSQTAISETSPGKMVNLLTNDVNRFDWALYFCHSLWISPLLTIVVAYLVYREIQFPGLIGIAVVFAVVPLLSYAGKLTSQYRLQTAFKTDERIRFMDEIISGVQVIKMYAWEKPFAALIAHTRKMELKIVRKSSYLRGFHMTSMMVTTRLALFCTMFANVLMSDTDHITASRIFAISTYFSITSFLMSLKFSRTIAETSEVYIALQRLENFFELDEKKTNIDYDTIGKNGTRIHAYENGTMRHSDAMKSPLEYTNVCISMKNVCARWSKRSTVKEAESVEKSLASTRHPPTLNGLSIEFERGKLVGIIGPVGSGKSSLLQALLKELPLESGSIDIDGIISYASQEPWIFAASIRQNILFGQEYNRDRYNAVVKCCALQRDFELLEHGDMTLIGDRGASVSGGQKARINLARACYREADIYLLDDPLSAVDAHVATHIFEKCIGPKGRLAKRWSTRILITHQVHFLKEADWIVVLKDGKVEIQGTPADLYGSQIDFAELVGVVGTADPVDNDESFDRRISQISTISLAPSIDVENPNVTEFDEGIELEATSKGKVKGSLLLSYFRAGADWPVLCLVIFLFVFVQFLASAVDYWVSYWTEQEEKRLWQEYEHPKHIMSTEACVCIHFALVGALLIFGVVRSLGFFTVCIRASQNIHNSMFKGIITTSMRFFDTNPSGRILNRFSKDLGTIDEITPKSLLDAIQNILSVIGSIVLAAMVNPYFLLPVLILCVAFAIIRDTYLKVSQNLRRLEGTAKSPAFTHLNSTLRGLSTVRAFNRQDILRKEFDNYQDMHSACWYVTIAWQTLFGLFLETMCTIFVTCVIFYYMAYDLDENGDRIGLAISQAINLSGIVTWGVGQSSEASNQMIAVERLLEYRDLQPEKEPINPITAINDWPSKGCIEFRNVYYRYFIAGEPVLRGLSFVIKPMEKIGVVGRTGAGKSSLIGALFRLACIDGGILIDGIDTLNVRLEDLRKRIAIIPQDPVLFSGTLRRNLDPFEEYSDAEIWSALDSVELKSIVSDAFGLESVVMPHGANYSIGQRQLLCLARAILRKNRILVLDEATANVDPQTDLLIQRTIRTNFKGCTVLTIAHRLHTIIDSDRILVMDAGVAVEFDEPYMLLLNKGGIFYGMVNALGENECERLTQLAYESSTTTDL